MKFEDEVDNLSDKLYAVVTVLAILVLFGDLGVLVWMALK